MTVTRRMRLAALAVAGVSILLVMLAIFAVWIRYTVTERTNELSSQCQAIAAGLEAGGTIDTSASPPLTGLRGQLFEIEAGLMGVRLMLVADDGSVLQSSGSGEMMTTCDIERLTDVTAEGDIRTGVVSVSGAGRVIVVAAPVETSGGQIYLVAVESLRVLAGAWRSGGATLVVVALAAFVAAWLIGGAVVRRVAAPIVHLREGAEAISSGSWGHQVEVEGDQEVAALAVAFNEMSSRVGAAYSAQREFVADVSHELRTPMTSIRGFAEALAGDMVHDPAERRRAATIIVEEADRVEELVRALLSLADLDSGRVVLSAEPVDTAIIAQALVARHSSFAIGRGVDLDASGLGRSGMPLGDPGRVLQIASALIENALVHTPSGGSVRVHDASADGRWCLMVEDSGPGVPAEKRDQVFERFVRLDESRVTSNGNFGLGLSICKRLVELMGGTIGVDDSELGGARFIVTLCLTVDGD